MEGNGRQNDEVVCWYFHNLWWLSIGTIVLLLMLTILSLFMNAQLLNQTIMVHFNVRSTE